jgi:hypothetical protein
MPHLASPIVIQKVDLIPHARIKLATLSFDDFKVFGDQIFPIVKALESNLDL